MSSQRQLIQFVRRRQTPKDDPLSPSEKMRIALELKEWCDAPFYVGCEVTYTLADYNREISIAKERLRLHEQLVTE